MLSVILHFGTKNVFVLFKMLGNKPRASCILDKCFATELKIMEAESHPHWALIHTQTAGFNLIQESTYLC